MKLLLKSMTGFGRGEGEVEGIKGIIEIRSVNHRFCETAVRLPRIYLVFEDRIKKKIQKFIERGRLDIYVNISDNREKKRKVNLDKDLLVEYYKCLREMAKILEIDFSLGIMDLAVLPEIFHVEEEENDIEAIWEVLEKALELAAGQLVSMRLQEGASLYQDFLSRCQYLEGLVRQIQERAPLLAEEVRAKLQNKVETLLGEKVEEERLLQEVLLHVERNDITEEIVRMLSHLKQFLQHLEKNEPVGRRLDFLLQEMNREINTIGSKSSDLLVSSLVVEAKSELEKMREQVQNVE